MGAIGVIEATVGGNVLSGVGNDDFVEVKTTENLVEGTTYYVICNAILQANGEADLMFSWRMYDETNSAVLADSTTTREMARTANQESYQFVGRFTAGATTGGLQFQQKGYGGTGGGATYKPAVTRFLSLILLDMSEIDPENYFFAEQEGGSELIGTSWEDLEGTTHTVEDSNGHTHNGDTWLVFGWCAYKVNSLDKFHEFRLVHRENDIDQTILPNMGFTGTNLDDDVCWWMARTYTFDEPACPTGTNCKPQEFTIQARAEGTGSHPYVVNSCLFGIRLDASTRYYSLFADTTRENDYRVWESVGGNTFTPITTDKVLVLGYLTYAGEGQDDMGFQKILLDDAEIPNDRPDLFAAVSMTADDDVLPMSYITVFDGVKDTEYGIVQYAKTTDSSGATQQYDQTRVYLSTRYGIPVTFLPVAKEVYTSGDVESQTFDAGAKAAQGFASGDTEAQGFAGGDTASQSHSGGDVETEARP